MSTIAGSIASPRASLSADQAPGERWLGRKRRVPVPIVVCGVLLLAAHGIAHVVGFATAWGLSDGLIASQSYTLVGGLDVVELKALGLLWLLALVLFLVAAAGLALGRPRWHLTAFAATLLSMVLCLLWLEPAKIGAIVDLPLFIGLLMTADSGVGSSESGFDGSASSRPVAPPEVHI